MQRIHGQGHPGTPPVAIALCRQECWPEQDPMPSAVMDFLDRQPTGRLRVAVILGCAAFWGILALSLLHIA